VGHVLTENSYVIADYDRAQFKVSQALFPKDTPKKLVDILPPSAKDSEEAQPSSSPSNEASSSKGVSPGVIAGIVVGAAVALAAIVALVWWLRRRRAKRLAGSSRGCTIDQHYGVVNGTELPDQGFSELSNSTQIKVELSADASGKTPYMRQELHAGSVRKRAGDPVEMP